MFHFNAVFHRAISQAIIKLCTWLKGLILHISCSCFGFPSGKTHAVRVAPRAANHRALLSVAWDIFSGEGGSTEGFQVRGATAAISLLCSLFKKRTSRTRALGAPEEEVRGWVSRLFTKRDWEQMGLQKEEPVLRSVLRSATKAAGGDLGHFLYLTNTKATGFQK